MTKLEELTALLVNEINDFNTSVVKLDKINEELKTTKIKMDVTEYKSIIEEHQKQMTSQLNSIQQFESRFNKKINKVKKYLDWGLILLVLSVIVGIVLIGLNVIQKI